MNTRLPAFHRTRLRPGLHLATAALACAATLAPARAEPPSPKEPIIGYVKTVQGDATVTQQGRQVPAQAGLALTRGALLSTGTSGGLGVTFKDDSIVSLGAEAQMQVDDYAYDPMAGVYRMRSTLRSGPLYYVPGVIAKAGPDAVQITTPQGTMHIHGARLLARTSRGDVQEAAR